jgi:hypothetical protein
VLPGRPASTALSPSVASSAESGEALTGAIADAESSEPARHAALLARLRTRAFLNTLDSAADYAEAARLGLHVGKVVEALARNQAPSARKAFLALTSDRNFVAHDDRVLALLRAGANVRPAPPALVRFWDRRSRFEDGFSPTTISALVDNGSLPALALLERKLVDPSHPDDDKLAWMRGDIISHRNDLPLLQECARLLAGKLKKGLRPSLVEVLFDYRPGEWFRPATAIPVPALEAASPEARAELRKLAAVALKTVVLTATQRSAVELRLRELDRLAEEHH